MSELKEVFKYSPKYWKILFWICFGVAMTLLIVSFILPPQGVIDPSVLQATGEILAFPTIYAAYECVMRGIEVKLSKGDMSLEVKNKSNHDEA